MNAAIGAALNADLKFRQRVDFNAGSAVVTTTGVINAQAARVDARTTGTPGRIDSVADADSYFVRVEQSGAKCWRLTGTTARVRAGLRDEAAARRLAATIALGVYAQVFPNLLRGATAQDESALTNGSGQVPIAIHLQAARSRSPSPVRPLIQSLLETNSRISNASIDIDRGGVLHAFRLTVSYPAPSGVVSSAITQTYARSAQPPRGGTELARCGTS